MAKLNFKEKHHILEVDGVEYEIPQRTAWREKLLNEFNTKRNELSEYEANFEFLKIIFGEEKAKQMFPDEDNTNLDKLAKCVKLTNALYLAEVTKIQQEKIEETVKELEPMLKPLKDAVNTIDKANTKAFVAKKRK